MTTIYHVCRGEWDGCDLLPLTARLPWDDAAIDYIAVSWPDCAGREWEYYCREGIVVHCHFDLDQAREFAAEFGGQILRIDADGLDVSIGKEYPHPVVSGAIHSSRISRI